MHFDDTIEWAVFSSFGRIDELINAREAPPDAGSNASEERAAARMGVSISVLNIPAVAFGTAQVRIYPNG